MACGQELLDSQAALRAQLQEQLQVGKGSACPTSHFWVPASQVLRKRWVTQEQAPYDPAPVSQNAEDGLEERLAGATEYCERRAVQGTSGAASSDCQPCPSLSRVPRTVRAWAYSDFGLPVGSSPCKSRGVHTCMADGCSLTARIARGAGRQVLALSKGSPRAMCSVVERMTGQVRLHVAGVNPQTICAALSAQRPDASGVPRTGAGSQQPAGAHGAHRRARGGGRAGAAAGRLAPDRLSRSDTASVCLAAWLSDLCPRAPPVRALS